MTRTGLMTSEVFLQHDTGAAHPERPERLSALLQGLESSGLMSELDRRDASPADPSWIDRVHAAGFGASVRTAIESGLERLDADTTVSGESWNAALRATGGALTAADEILAGNWSNAFVAARPPGHHAEHSQAMGFCLINHVAICAQYLRSHHGLERVAILDWDVHHGNGTQHLTESDPNVFFASLHQFPHYPGTGAATERGRGDGEGSVLNCPMQAGADDRDYLREFESQVLPSIEAFDPDFILISAGFDAHERDPLSSTRVSAEGFEAMSAGILDLARKCCQGRLLSVLEGGYDLQGLAESATAHLQVLHGAN